MRQNFGSATAALHEVAEAITSLSGVSGIEQKLVQDRRWHLCSTPHDSAEQVDSEPVPDVPRSRAKVECRVGCRPSRILTPLICRAQRRAERTMCDADKGLHPTARTIVTANRVTGKMGGRRGAGPPPPLPPGAIRPNPARPPAPETSVMSA
jgi:hypothetical protein